MKTARYLVVSLLTAAALAGCVTNYQYLSRGEIATAAGGPRSAVLYWQKDEGRLWYGKKYEQVDTSLTMRVCEEVPKPFSLGNGKHLVLFSRSGDRRVGEIADNGTVKRLAAPQPVGEDSDCGFILLDGAPTDTAHLATGTRPAVAIVCDNVRRPDRYPPIGIYAFGAVSRTETDKDRTAPDPCARP